MGHLYPGCLSVIDGLQTPYQGSYITTTCASASQTTTYPSTSDINTYIPASTSTSLSASATAAYLCTNSCSNCSSNTIPNSISATSTFQQQPQPHNIVPPLSSTYLPQAPTAHQVSNFTTAQPAVTHTLPLVSPVPAATATAMNNPPPIAGGSGTAHNVSVQSINSMLRDYDPDTCPMSVSQMNTPNPFASEEDKDDNAQL